MVVVNKKQHSREIEITRDRTQNFFISNKLADMDYLLPFLKFVRKASSFNKSSYKNKFFDVSFYVYGFKCPI